MATQSQTTYAISLVWDRQDECQRIVDAFRAQYIEEVGLESEANSVATGKFLDSEINDYLQRMRQAESVLIKYRTSNTGQLPEAQSAAISQLGSLQAQLDNMNISGHDAEMKRQALLQRIAQVHPMSVLEQATAESPLVTQIKQLEAQRDAMLAGNMLPTHPEVQALTDQIDALKKQAQDKANSGAPEAQGAVSTKLQDNPEYQALQQQLLDANIAQQTQAAQVKLLQQQIAQYQVRVEQIPSAQRELTDKTRDYTVLKTEYEALLARREQAQLRGSLAKVSASSSLSPIGAVYAESTTSKSKLILMLAGSIVLGLVVGVIAVVAGEWSDHSVRYSSDAERLFGVPVLGAVPESRALFAPGLTDGRASRGRLPAPDTRAVGAGRP